METIYLNGERVSWFSYLILGLYEWLKRNKMEGMFVLVEYVGYIEYFSGCMTYMTDGTKLRWYQVTQCAEL